MTAREDPRKGHGVELDEVAPPPPGSDGRAPDFLYIGTSKAGSTWLYAVLSEHPEVYLDRGKGLYFFSDHYDRGLDWYLRHFRGTDGHRAVGEMSHNYLYAEEAPGRIADLNPRMKLLACVREPAERAFSDYLHHVKNGQLDVSFEEALEQMPSLAERGRYHAYLAPYIERFGHDQVHVGLFDELRDDPDAFANRVFDFLGVARWTLPPRLRGKYMPAGEPRVRAAAAGAKAVARLARRIGLRSVVGRAKRSRRVRGLLYRAYDGGEKPTMHPETREALRRTFRPEVERLDALLGTDFGRRWGY